MLTPGTLQRSNPRMMVWAELPKADRERLVFHAVTFHTSPFTFYSRPVKGEAYSSIREGEATSL
jgi:hypothetical protein